MTNPSGDPRFRTWDRPADRLRTAAESAYERARSNPELTPQARQGRIAAAYQQLRDEMTVLQSRAQSSAQQDTAAFKRKVFGIDDILSATPGQAATIAISFRDAQDRASALTSDPEALTLLDNATATGDELLARAIGNAALVGGPMGPMFPDTAEKYLGDRPDKAAALTQLQGAQWPLPVADLWEYVTPTPTELAGMAEATIASLASQSANLRATSQ